MSDLIERLLRTKDGLTLRVDRDAINEACNALAAIAAKDITLRFPSDTKVCAGIARVSLPGKRLPGSAVKALGESSHG